MAIEDFTTYTEDDPNDRITKTASKVSWVGLTRSEDAYVYKDFTAGYFPSNFEMRLTHQTTLQSVAGSWSLSVWTLANLVDDFKGIDDANGDYLAIIAGETLAGVNRLVAAECYQGTLYFSDAYIGLTDGTDYYLTVERDETVGTYGTLYLYIYSDSARQTLLATLSVALHGKVDFRYLYAVQTQNIPTGWHTGYTESLEIISVSPSFIPQVIII